MGVAALAGDGDEQRRERFWRLVLSVRNRVRHDAYRAVSSHYTQTCGTVAELSACARLIAGPSTALASLRIRNGKVGHERVGPGLYRDIHQLQAG
jgi:hypothetical protein